MSKVVVLGSFNMDLCARVSKFPIPGESILSHHIEMQPGGKGLNQAIASHRAGADVRFIVKIGDDEFGTSLRELCTRENMRQDAIITGAQSTGTAFIIVQEQTAQNMIVINSGANMCIAAEELQNVFPVLHKEDLLLMQLEINLDALEFAVAKAKESHTRIILNPAPARELSEHLLRNIDIITPNETEAEILTGIAIHNLENAQQAANVLLKKGVGSVIITLGEQGSLVATKNYSKHLPPIKVKAVDTSGAGDAFNGGLAAALVRGENLLQAAQYGNVAGALAVTQFGTAYAMANTQEILQMYQQTYGDLNE